MQVAWSHRSAQRRREIILPPGSVSTLRPMKVEDRSRILHAIATARTWLDDLIASLSPTIVRALIEGRLLRGIGIKHLADLPASWAEQHAALGV